MPEKTIWTIGHSTRSAEEFLALLRSFNIELLVDIRNYPGSKRFPHFNKENLEALLTSNGVSYLHIKDLGGRRKALPDSVNTSWQHSAFRGYADYMETEPFKQAIDKLEKLAQRQRTAYMCAEALWWSCHRALVSDYLKALGWTVIHILQESKSQVHPYTRAARIENGQLSYRLPDLFS
jgi:uncharacterized protein (DUF488 family)